MNRPLTLVIAVGLLTLTACSSDGSTDTDPAPPTSTASTSATPSHSTSPTATDPAEARCQVKGFVPSSTYHVQRSRPIIVWAKRYTVAADTGIGERLANLGLFDPLPLEVRADDPDTTLTAVERAAILASGGGPVKDGKVLELSVHPVHITNRTGRDQVYLAFRGGAAYQGTWKLRDCGSPYNDGRSILVRTGTYSTLGPVRHFGIAQCGATPDLGSALDRYAARRACQK